MYDRAPRTLTKPADSTGGSVGPGSYEAPTYGPKKYGKNYASVKIKTSEVASQYNYFS